MVGKKRFLKSVLVGMLGVSLLAGCGGQPTASTENKEVIKIGISQLVEHPALDASREGFIAALEENGFEDGKNIKIEIQNAQGDIATTQTIASSFVGDKKDLILAI